MVLLPVLLILAAVPEPGVVPRAGYFGAGINLEPLTLGPVQAFASGGTAMGVSLQSALQIDLGPRWALRLPLGAALAGESPSDFVELSFTPGVIHRWRDDADQAWVPYVGGGLKLGLFGAGRGLLGLPLIASRQALDLDFGDDGGDPDPNEEVDLGALPELWGGVEWHPNRWCSLHLGAAYSYVRVAGRNVHVLHERVGVRFSL